jgi:hypothetical protein
MQTEAFLEFKAQYPEIEIKQRKFESLKPFFVRAARERDRRSCLCRKHVEAQIVFKDCMKYRKTGSDPLIPPTLTDAANITLCPKDNTAEHHHLNCLTRA